MWIKVIDVLLGLIDAAWWMTEKEVMGSRTSSVVYFCLAVVVPNWWGWME